MPLGNRVPLYMKCSRVAPEAEEEPLAPPEKIPLLMQPIARPKPSQQQQGSSSQTPSKSNSKSKKNKNKNICIGPPPPGVILIRPCLHCGDVIEPEKEEAAILEPTPWNIPPPPQLIEDVAPEPQYDHAPEPIDLHNAVACDSDEIVLRIIASTDRRTLRKQLIRLDAMGMTPLMIACQRCNVGLVRVLMASGAWPDTTSYKNRRNAPMCAAIGGNIQIIDILDKAGGVDWFKRDKAGYNALHHAITGGHVLAVKYLLGCLMGYQYIEDKDGFGWTPLLRAIIVKAPEEMIQYLLEKGANPNAVDKLGLKSCLIAAVSRNDSRASVVKLLLRFGANPFYENSLGENALVLASGLEIVNLVRDKMIELELKIWPTRPSRPSDPLYLRRGRQPSAAQQPPPALPAEATIIPPAEGPTILPPAEAPIVTPPAPQIQSEEPLLVPPTPQIQTGPPSAVLPQGEVDAAVKASLDAALYHQDQAAPGTVAAMKAAAAVARAARGKDLADSRDNDTRFDERPVQGEPDAGGDGVDGIWGWGWEWLSSWWNHPPPPKKTPEEIEEFLSDIS